jgi:peptidyl-prolyl cis-trans isomerase B (cyclophilin B)
MENTMKCHQMIILLIVVLCIPTMACSENKNAAPLGKTATGTATVRLETTKGDIVIELLPEKAPKTVENFLTYVRDGYYDGTLFHRVIKGFMIQGGGMTETMQPKKTRSPISNEADNQLKNVVGSIAMARTPEPHSATSQFFINVSDNAPLDHKDKSSQWWGYCVFGKVIKGMDVVHAIENVKTTTRAGHRDVPVEPVVIKHAVIISPTKAADH